MTAAVYVEDASHVDIRSPIFEGENPMANVRATFVGSNNVRTFYCDKAHVENKPYVASFDLSLSSGRYELTRIWNQTCNKLVRVRRDSKSYSDLIIDYSYMPAAAGFLMQEKGLNDAVYWQVKCPFTVGQGAKYLDALFKQDKDFEIPYYRKIMNE